MEFRLFADGGAKSSAKPNLYSGKSCRSKKETKKIKVRKNLSYAKKNLSFRRKI